MKSRILLPLLLLLIVLLFGGYFIASRFFNVNQRARVYLTGKASEILGGHFDASSVFILPWSITIRDAHLKLQITPLSFIEISVKRIRIGFSIIEFVKNGFRPIYGTEKVYLDRPEFILINIGPDSTSGTFTVEKVPVLPVGKIPRMRININKGALGVRTAETLHATSLLADGISGWLDASLSTVINLNLEGNVLSKEKNMTLTGSLNREENSYAFDLKCSNGDLAHQNFAGLIRDNDIDVLGGVLNVTARIRQEKNEVTVNGSVSVEHGFLRLNKGFQPDAGIEIRDISITATANENEVVFDTISASVLDVAPVLTGKLVLRPDIALLLKISARNVDLSKMLSELHPSASEQEKNLTGSIDIDATVEGPLAKLKTTAECTAESIHYGDHRLDRVGAHLQIEGNRLVVTDAAAFYRDFAIRGQGNTDLLANSPRKTFSVALTASRRNKGLQPLACSLKLTGFTQPKNKGLQSLTKAKFQLKRQISDFPEYFSWTGNLTLAGDTLDFSAGNKVVTLKGTAKNIFKQPEILSTVECNSVSVLNFFGHTSDDVVLDGLGTLSGAVDRLRLDGDFRLAAYGEVNTNVRGRIYSEKPFTSSRRFDVSVQLTDLRVHDSHPMLLKLNAIADSASAHLNAVDDDGVSLVVDADVNTGAINGYCDLEKFPLERIIDIFRKEETGHTGRLTGRAEFGGTLKDPWFTTPQPIAVSNLKVGGLDRLSGDGRVFGKIGELTFSDVRISRNGIPIMDAQGVWISGKPFIMNARGEAVQLSAISDIISSDRTTDGKTDYRFSMVFTRESGTIDGDFSLHDGHFYDIPIDEAHGLLGGGSAGFTVTDFTVKKNGLYEGKGSAASGYLWKDETETPGLRMNLVFSGDLLRAIPYLTDSIRKASGKSQLNVVVGGTWQDPVVLDGELYVTDATIVPAFLVNKITDVTAILKIDPDLTTMSGYTGVRVRVASGMVNNKKLIVQNVHIGDKEWDAIKRPHLVSVVNNDVSLDFGVFTGLIENTKGRTRDNALDLHIPGFMEPNGTGKFELSGDAGGKFFVGASQGDEELTPYIAGKILVRSGEVTYPLLPVPSLSGNSEDTGFLDDIFWDLELSAGPSVYYFNEVNQQWGILGTTVSRTLGKLEENSWFKVFGRLSDGSFRVTGNARSTSGSVSYFGADFNIERVEFDVDTSREERPSILTGRAQTVVFDSTGVQTEIYLNVSTVDSKSDQVRRAPGRPEAVYEYGDIRQFDVQGLGTLQIVFSSTDPTDDTQEKILAKLGISSEKFGSTAARAFTSGFDSYYMNRWLRPFEDIIRKYTRLDVIQFSPSVLGNIMRSQLGFSQRFAPESNYMLFDETRIVLGESLFKEWFLSYQGEYGLSRDFLSRRERGFFHEIGLQYNLKRNTRLQLKYFYDDVIKEGERRFEIRHDFAF